MTLLSGRKGTYLLLATLALGALLAFGWVTLAGAQGQESDTENMSESGVPYEGPSGIWVSGNGIASGAPDIAVMSLGVESLEETASAARTKAAEAMQSVMSALEEADVEESDIQTRHFSISPRYQQVQVKRCDDDGSSAKGGATESAEQSCYTVWESRLIGYSVSNQVSVKVRDLNDAGAIIDSATEAAGNLVRINGINFDIEDPQQLQDEARANAVADLQRKAALLAELSGVKLGRLVYLSEGAAYAPYEEFEFFRAEAAMADSAAATLISGGELEFSVSLQGVFLIAGEVEE